MKPGARLGPYEVREPLGKGGMGEVYRVHDPTLQRDVAIKFLPVDLAADVERLGRLEDEARTLASLNHPGIATVHGFEEHDGIFVIVMELVEGPTLAEKLEDGPLGLEQAGEVAAQVARALAAAHARGVVHRDLKPANVKIAPDGRTKVLDFGLAKAMGSDREQVSDSDLVTAVRLPTRPGAVMGTAPYMSPEQARGLPLGRSTDIWSFGCLLYEMLVGKPAFSGDTAADVVADILRAEPDWRALPGRTPPQVVSLLRRCLTKDVRRRTRDVSEAVTILDALARGETGTVRAVTSAVRGACSRWAANVADALADRRRTPAALLAVMTVLVLAAAVGGFLLGDVTGRGSGPTGQQQPWSFTQLTGPPAEALYPSLSPDGQFLVYSSPASGDWDIYLQRVGGANPINLTGDSASDDTQPVYSPEGRYIAFRSDREGGGLFVMGATGENVRRISDHGHHPDWAPDGNRIVYSMAPVTGDPLVRGEIPSALRVISVDGGPHHELTAGDGVQPVWSPNGDRIAYWGVHKGGQRDIWTVPAAGGEPTQVTRHEAVDWNPAWAPDGSHLYFASDRGGSMNLWRVAIDEASGEVRSAPEPFTTPSTYSQHVRLAATGDALVYVQARRRISLRTISFDAAAGVTSGPPEFVRLGSRSPRNPDLSPDGEWYVFDSRSLDTRQEDLFVVGSDGTRIRRLTHDAYKDRGPRWSPDGDTISFLSDRSGRYECWLMNPDGSGLRRLSSTSDVRWAQAPIWAPDGDRLACNMSEGSPIVFDLDATDAAPAQRALAAPPAGAGSLFFAWSWSPDGGRLAGWLESGIFAYSFETDEFHRLTDFGERPRWLPDGRRLLFQSDAIHLVDPVTGAERIVYSPAPDRVQSFGLSRDGRLLYVAVQVNESDVWMALLR